MDQNQQRPNQNTGDAPAEAQIQVPQAQPVDVPDQTQPAPTQADPNQTESSQATPDTNQPPIPTPAQTPALSTDGDGQKSVIDVLLEQGKLTQEQHDQIKLESVNSGKPVEQLLHEQELVDDEVVVQAKSQILNIPYVRPSQLGASPEALTAVPQSVANRYQIFPFAIDKGDNTLSLAMVNPMDLSAISFVETKSGMRVIPHIASPLEVELAIQERYAQSLSSEVVQALKDVEKPEKRVVDVTQLGQVIREAPVAKIVETILSYAMKSGASDVHIEPQEERTRIRYRVDGILQEKLVLPREVHNSVVSRIKILANLKIDERRLPQDGRFAFSAGKEEVDLRISTLPTVHGEKIVMRLLKKNSRVPSLAELGMRGRALKNVEENVVKPNGIVLITGPTGSGKTTTLYSILSKISTPKVNVVTLEDPVEYEMAGVNQVQVNPQAGLTFASGLRAFLRQDPNIIMVGEIRDHETAELAVQASLTGHMVFSTLHTNSAAGALPRLIDMKVEPFLLASSMTLVMGQRVVRKLCEDSKEAYTPAPEIIQDIQKVLGPLFDSWLKQNNKTVEELQLYRPKPSDECGESGYKGRTAIYEVLPVTEKVARLIVEHASADEIEKQAMSEGMILMKQDGYLKALEGITTIEEVLRVAEI